MDKIYDFSWLINDIDESIIFLLQDGKETLESYSVSNLELNGLKDIHVKFANILDLTNFINYAMVRFAGSHNKNNIIDIPVRKLYKLYSASIEITDGIPKPLSLDDLETFSIFNNKVIKDGYAIYPYKINEISYELKELMHIAHTFNELNMNKQIEALEDINLLNYERSNRTTKNR